MSCLCLACQAELLACLCWLAVKRRKLVRNSYKFVQICTNSYKFVQISNNIFSKKAWCHFPSNRDILGLGLPRDNNFQPITSFVSLAILWQRDSGQCNLAWILPETRDLLSSRIYGFKFQPRPQIYNYDTYSYKWIIYYIVKLVIIRSGLRTPPQYLGYFSGHFHPQTVGFALPTKILDSFLASC